MTTRLTPPVPACPSLPVLPRGASLPLVQRGTGAARRAWHSSGHSLGFPASPTASASTTAQSQASITLRQSVCCQCAVQEQEQTTTEAYASELNATDREQEQQPGQQEGLNCISTGMDVSCFLDEPSNGVYTVRSPSPVTQPAEPATQLQPVLQAALMVSPFAFWGTSMVVMKGLMISVPPLVMGAFRLLPAGFLLVGWAASQGRPQPSTWKAWAWVAAFALVDGAAFQGFLAEGLTRTPAGLGSVIIDSQPLTVAVLAAWLFGEQLGLVGVLGLLLGVGGLLLLELPEQYVLLATGGLIDYCSDSFAALTGQAASTAGNLISSTATTAGQIASSITDSTPSATSQLLSTAATADLPANAAAVTSQLQATAGASTQLPSTAASALCPEGSAPGQDVWANVTGPMLMTLGSPSAWLASGEFWMLAAAQAMAVGTVMVRYVTRECDPVMATGWHMVLGGLVLTGAALASDPTSFTTAFDALGPQDILSAAYVSLLGGAASYGIFFYLASSSQGSLTQLSSLTFLTPVFAAVTGYLVLGEVLTAPQLLGGAVTLGSVLLITSSKNKPKQQPEQQ